MTFTPCSPACLIGEVQSAGTARRVWVFQVCPPGEEPESIVSVEGAACLRVVPFNRQISGSDMIMAGCDLLLAGQVIRLFNEHLALRPNPFLSPFGESEKSPIEGNQTPTKPTK